MRLRIIKRLTGVQDLQVSRALAHLCAAHGSVVGLCKARLARSTVQSRLLDALRDRDAEPPCAADGIVLWRS